jgi:hypothetical protein
MSWSRLLWSSVVLQFAGLVSASYGAVMLTIRGVCAWRAHNLAELLFLPGVGGGATSVTTSDSVVLPFFYVWWVLALQWTQLLAYLIYRPSRATFPNRLSFLCIACVFEALLIAFTRDTAWLLLYTIATQGLASTSFNYQAVLLVGCITSIVAVFLFILSLSTEIHEDIAPLAHPGYEDDRRLALESSSAPPSSLMRLNAPASGVPVVSTATVGTLQGPPSVGNV